MTDRSADGSGIGACDTGGAGPGDPGVPGPIRAPRPETRLTRAFFDRDVLEVAGDLIGCDIVAGAGPEQVVVRLSEVEAYAGADDPASHAYRGETARTAVMFGPPGFLYVYFVYGMHWCANVVTGPAGYAAAVLLRAGTVIGGIEVAGPRRPRADQDALARGPAALTGVLGITGADSGLDLCAPGARIGVRAGTPAPAGSVHTGPRVGVSTASERPWRFWRVGEVSVSRYRAGGRRRSSTLGGEPTAAGPARPVPPDRPTRPAMPDWAGG